MMQEKLYIKDNSLNIEDKEQTIQEIKQYSDDICLETNIKFTLKPNVEFFIEIPDREILIAVSKYHQSLLNDWKDNHQINLMIKDRGLLIGMEQDVSFKEFISNYIKSEFDQYHSRKLNFDKDSLRALYPSHFISNQLQKQQLYLIKSKILDNSIQMYLVSKQSYLLNAVENLENKLRGIRIFFQSCTSCMTIKKQNKEIYECLTKLRLEYHQKRGKNELQKCFQNLIFIDAIDKQKPFCSLTMGFNFPFFLEGKQAINQNIYKYVQCYIQTQFAIFIQFSSINENLNLINDLVGLLNNAQSEDKFLCSCEKFLHIQTIGIFGNPQDLIKLTESVLIPNCSRFEKNTFFENMQISILLDNFLYTADEINYEFDNVCESLQKHSKLKLSQFQQLKSIKQMEQPSKIIKYLCDKKIKFTTQATEKIQQERLLYIQAIPKNINEEEDLFKTLNVDLTLKYSKNKQKNVPSIQNNQKQKQKVDVEQQFKVDQKIQQVANQQSNKKETQSISGLSKPPCNSKSSNELLKSPASKQTISQQKHLTNSELQNLQQDSKTDTNSQISHCKSQSTKSLKFSEEENINQIEPQDNDEPKQIIDFIGGLISDNSQIDDEKKKHNFYFNIISGKKETNNQFIIHQEYKEYFQKLTQNEVNLSKFGDNQSANQILGYICIKKNLVFQLKYFDRCLRIYQKVDDAIEFCKSQQEENYLVIQVLININAEKTHQVSFDEEDNQIFFELNDHNQIYPIKQIEF